MAERERGMAKHGFSSCPQDENMQNLVATGEKSFPLLRLRRFNAHANTQPRLWQVPLCPHGIMKLLYTSGSFTLIPFSYTQRNQMFNPARDYFPTYVNDNTIYLVSFCWWSPKLNVGWVWFYFFYYFTRKGIRNITYSFVSNHSAV